MYSLELLRFITVSCYSIKAVRFSIHAAWYSLELLGITLKLHGIPPINIRFGFVALSGYICLTEDAAATTVENNEGLNRECSPAKRVRENE